MGGVINQGEPNEQVKNLDKFREYLPNLKVMANARPEDKYLLLIGLRNCDASVAVVADDSKDAQSLVRADVSFSCGISGT